MKTRTLLAIAVIACCINPAYSQLIQSSVRVGTEALTEEGLKVFVPALETGLTTATGLGAQSIGKQSAQGLSVPTLSTSLLPMPKNSTITALVPVSKVQTLPLNPPKLPSFASGDLLAKVGNFHLYHQGTWYLVHPGATAEKLSTQPTQIIFPSQRLRSPEFADFLRKNNWAVDPKKTSRFDSAISNTEKFTNSAKSPSTTAPVPVSGVQTLPLNPPGLPSFASGDMLVRVGNFHLYHQGTWYLVHPGATAEKLLKQPTQIIFPSQRLHSSEFTDFLRENNWAIDPKKTSHFDQLISDTEKFRIFLLRMRTLVH